LGNPKGRQAHFSIQIGQPQEKDQSRASKAVKDRIDMRAVPNACVQSFHLLSAFASGVPFAEQISATARSRSALEIPLLTDPR
jgi:hypothetical protein